MGISGDHQKLKVVEDIDRPKFLLTPNTEWRKTEQEFVSAMQEDAENYVYQMVLNFGATAKLIAQRFGLDQKAVEATFGHVIRRAQAELTMLIYGDQITAALETTSSQMKMHVGKHFAGQIENQQLTTQDQDGNDIEFKVNVVTVNKKKNDDAGSISETEL
jgi:hypothetical protein